MLQVGEQAPSFTVQSSKGALELAKLLEGGPAVIYFFPKAFTSG